MQSGEILMPTYGRRWRCGAGRGKTCKISSGRNLRNAIGIRVALIHVARNYLRNYS